MKARRIMIGLTALAGLALSVALLTGCDDEATANTAPDAASTVAAPQTTATADATPESPLVEPTVSPTEPVDPPTDEASPEMVTTQVAELVAIEELIASSGSYAGKAVTVRGEILTQCMRGCLFSVDDGTGVIGIELVDEGLENLIAQGSVGRTVRVTGVVEGTSRPSILVRKPGDWEFDD